MPLPSLLRLMPAMLLAGFAVTGPLMAQQPYSHIPFCSSDSSARALVEQIRFRVAGTDPRSRHAQAVIGLGPMGASDVVLVVDEGICLAASAAYARNGGTPGGMPAPFPVAVVRAGDRYVVRLPEADPAATGDPLTLVFDLGFKRLGGYGGDP